MTNWISFWDAYNSAVHDNTVLSKVDIFNYLNSLLEGEAKRSIEALLCQSQITIQRRKFFMSALGNPSK